MQPTHTQLLLFLTKSVHDPLAWHAVQLADAACQDAQTRLRVFFYQDAVQIANAYQWQPQDRASLQQAWQRLASQYQLVLPVCVSAALVRGVTDHDNALRHHITQPIPVHTPPSQAIESVTANNLATDFSLVGLGELAEQLYWADKVVHL